MICDECGCTIDVHTYDDPDLDGTVNLCDRCADHIVGEIPVDTGDEEDCDDEFTDACTTAADYMRADGNW